MKREAGKEIWEKRNKWKMRKEKQEINGLTGKERKRITEKKVKQRRKEKKD